MNKIEATKYILLQLCNWYYELNPSKEVSGENDLSILKSLKLIFFLSPLDFNQRKLLDDNFKFEAWALGPVEVDIYDNRSNLELDLNNKKTNYQNLLKHSFNELTTEDKLFIEKIVFQLKEKNNKLINYSATQLVNLTHKYSSWINNYKTNSSKGDCVISKEQIIEEEKYYFL